MSLLTLSDASFDYGREKILAGVDLTLQPGRRYALVGPNGAGKTTLLSVLAGEISLQGGQRQSAGRLQVEYLRQETALGEAATDQRPLAALVRERAFTRELALQAQLAQVNDRVAAAGSAVPADLLREHGRLQSEFERLEGYTLEVRLETALAGVGLAPETWPRPVARLSGGERRRAALAATLLSPADLLLLDEPTNHLDLASCEWLETWLQQCRQTVVMVSHDRAFLDRTAERTLHLDRGRLVEYPGNYTVYLRLSAERRQQEVAAWQRQQDQIRQTEALIRKTHASGGQKSRQAQARRKALDRIERTDPPPASPTRAYRFRLEPVRTSGGTVLQAEGLTHGHGGRTLFRDLDLHVVRGERVGIIGPNGCGKTTLLRVLSGVETPAAGHVVRGHNVDLGVYDQNLQLVSDHHTVLGEMAAVDPTATLGDLRTFLGAFGFGEDLVDRPVGDLSGGERARLSLLRLIKEGHNTLLLDEPTNHLDVRSREALEAALQDFNGTLVVVSHDRRFLDKVIERLVVFPDTGAADTAGPQPRVFAGNYADLVRARSQESRPPEPATAPARPADASPRAQPANGGRPGLSKNEQARRRRWIEEAETRIEALEAEKAAAVAEMARPDLDAERRLALGARCAGIEDELAAALADWERWHAEIEGEAGEEREA